MKASLTIKMFVLIFVSIVLLFSCIGIFQYVYYQSFYESSKIEETANNLEKYVSDYIKEDWSLEEQVIQLKKFNLHNSAYLDVMKLSESQLISEASIEELEPLFQGKVVVSAINSENTYFDFMLEEEILEQIMNDPDKTEKQGIYISGNVDSSMTIYPTSINAIEINSSSPPEDSDSYADTLELVEIYKPASQTIALNGQPYYLGTSPEFKQGKIGEITYTITNMPNTSVRQVNFFYPKTIKDETHMFLATISLQSVEESMAIYQKFLPLLFVTTIVLAALISFIYSKQVSKPIVEITHVANNMSHLNFDQSLPEDRQDELGILSKSINTLSNSLNQSLQDLTEAHEKLKEDYENEIKQEKIRRDFVANVSHEIKTPLGIIKSYAEGVKDVVKKEKQDYYIDVMVDEIERMNQMLNELLELSKLDSGYAVYNIRPFDVKATLESLIKHYDYMLVDKHMTIEVIGDFITIDADPEKMYQVYNNLISNAIKYGIENTKIVIQGQVKETFMLTFKNKCQPLTKDQNESIWLRFYKVDESHQRDIEGNGLGLSIVKSIIEGHDYKIKSIVDDTSISFTIDMPLN
ncbi:HAMP domain-containing histidine kinase [Acidaminobacter sp. JC074]|uniref:sensor histidine kinase n=1 Tax=Acidaminobacter sp. JC074 TaxID=2530199 RepID=UPI001F112FD2|nr:HAMP domain-containing sensor histidine kinase [Acidaminobacter sp. JC074]MCH4887902.1 HAMP domain-containing histidine kinase [Acidaminobacter sp. JC074]